MRRLSVVLLVPREDWPAALTITPKHLDTTDSQDDPRFDGIGKF